jgi:pilus assembly protein FimV
VASETVDAGEVDTKLDLAKAFLEMGDAEGAKDILEEIRQEGNETQRKEAEKLLAGIS